MNPAAPVSSIRMQQRLAGATRPSPAADEIAQIGPTGVSITLIWAISVSWSGRR